MFDKKKLQVSSQNLRVGDMLVSKPITKEYDAGYEIAFSKCPKCKENDKLFDKHTESFLCNKCGEMWRLNDNLHN